MQPKTTQAFQRTQNPVAVYDFALDVAGDRVLPIQGNFLLVDMASTGKVLLDINVEHQSKEPLISAGRGFSYDGEFGTLRIKNTSQPGKIIRLIIGRDASVKGSASDGNFYDSVGEGNTWTTKNVGYPAPNTMPLIPTGIPLVSSLSNPSGTIIKNSSILLSEGAAGQYAHMILFAKKGANNAADFSAGPSTTDSSIIDSCYVFGLTTGNIFTAKSINRKIPPGWGIGYVQNSTVNTYYYSFAISFEIG